MEQFVALVTQDLRYALLLAGAIVLGGILAWELLQRWRSRRAERTILRGPLGASADRDEVDDPDDPLFGQDEDPAMARITRRGEPYIDEDTERDEPTVTLPPLSRRDRLREPPLMDLDVALRGASSGEGLPVMQTPSMGSAAVTPPPRLELPAEDRRVIVALRVVARGEERFSGLALRQALLGEGFAFGDMEIFHRPLADGRVLLSAANLTQPGKFEIATMDAARFLGLNVFAVLPGPLPGRDTVDKLLLVGQALAQRLRGQLRDAQGLAVTEATLAAMRAQAAVAAG